MHFRAGLDAFASYRYDWAMFPGVRPMPLLRVADAFDHPDWRFELKHDGFRALAHIDWPPLHVGFPPATRL
jgi:ATP-dependent DNA ligase